MGVVDPDSADPASTRSKSSRPRWRRWLLGGLLLAAGLIVVILVALGQPPIATAVAKAVLSGVHPLPRATLELREARGLGLTHLDVRGLRLTRGDTLIAAVESVRARYGLASLLTGELHVRDLTIDGLFLTPELWSGAPEPRPPRPPGPPLTLERLLRGRFYSGLAFRIDRLALRGELRAAPESTQTTVTLDARRIRLGKRFSFAIDSLRAHRQESAAGAGLELDLRARLENGRFEAPVLRFRGDSSAVNGNAWMAVDSADSVSARIVLDARPLNLRDLAAFLPRANLDGALWTEIDLRGTRRDRLSGTMALSTERLRVGALELDDTRLSATLDQGRSETFLSGSLSDARVEVVGWMRPFDLQPTYDLEIKADRFPRRLPGVSAWPQIAERASSRFAFRIQGAGYARPVVDLRGGTSGEVGGVELDGHVDFRAGVSWSVRRLRFENLDVARIVGDTTTSSLSGTLTTSAKEAATSFRSLVASLQLDPSSYGEWAITAGNARASIDGARVGASMRLATEAGTFELDSLVGRWQEGGELRLMGARFRDIDLAQLTAHPERSSQLSGTLSGRFRGLPSLTQPPDARTALRAGRVSGDLRLELGASRWRQQSIDRGTASLSLSAGRVRGNARIESGAGEIELAGEGRPFDAAPSYRLDRGRFTNLDLAGWTGSEGLRSRLTGSLSASARKSAWDGRLRLERSGFGQAVLQGGDVHGSGSRGLTRVDGVVRFGKDPLSLRGEVVTSGPAPRGQAELSVPVAAIAALFGDTSRATGALKAQASFVGLDARTSTLEGTVVGTGSVGALRLDSLFAALHLQRGILTLDTLLARSNVATAAGAGRIAWFDSTADSHLGVKVRVDDLAPLRALMEADTMSVDTANVDLRVHGSRGVRRFEMRGSVRSLAWNDARLHSADASMVGELDSRWQPIRTRVDASLNRLRGTPLPLNHGVARIDADPVTTRFDLTAVRDERHRLHLVGDARRDSVVNHIAIATLDIQADSAAWALTAPAAIDLGADRVDVKGFELRSATGRIAARGIIDRRGHQDFRLDLKDAGFDVVSALFGGPAVSAVLNGHIALEGPAQAPRGNGNLEVRLRSGDRPAGAVRSALAWNGTRLDFRGNFASPEGDSIVWNGGLPLTLSLAVSDSAPLAPVRVTEGAVDVRLAARQFPLETLSPLLDPHTVGALEGMLDLDVRLRGTSRSITGQGSVDVSGGAVPLPGLGVTYRDLELHGAFEGDRLIVRRAHAVSAKGTLDASGDVRLVGLTRVEPRLHVESRQFAFVQSTDLRAIASGKIDLTGTLTSPIVRGSATIENSSFYLTPVETEAGQPAAKVQLTDDDLRMLEATFGEVKTAAPNAALLFYDASDLDLTIRLERNNWVRQRARPKLAVALTGDFRLQKAPHGDPLLFGRIEPLPNRGYVEQFARSFDIKGGEVLLNGAMKDHRMDLQAEYKPPSSSESDEDETVIHLDVEGSPEKPKLVLSSDPPMSEVEIVSFIATGQSPDKPGTSGSNSSLAKDIGLSQVTGFAEEAAQEAIGLDVLQVRFDALQGATLVAGRYLDNQLYVGFRQPLQYKDPGTSSENGVTTRTSVEVEYAIYRWLLLNLQGETSKVRSFFRVRHAY